MGHGELEYFILKILLLLWCIFRIPSTMHDYLFLHTLKGTSLLRAPENLSILSLEPNG